MEALKPRRDVLGLSEREIAADLAFRTQRDETIAHLQAAQGLSKAAATRIFNGTGKTERNPLLPAEPKSPAPTMAETLKRQVNLNNGLRADRRIG